MGRKRGQMAAGKGISRKGLVDRFYLLWSLRNGFMTKDAAMQKLPDFFVCGMNKISHLLCRLFDWMKLWKSVLN